MIRFFPQFSEITALVSEREDGSMRLGGSDGDLENRKKFFERNLIDPNKVFGALLVHGKKVAAVPSESTRVFSATDALVSNEKQIFLSVTGADCFPVFFYDPKKSIVGIAHAGWRGTIANIMREMVEKMKVLGSNLENIHIEFGPGICREHFSLPIENKEKFRNYIFATEEKDEKIFIDLQTILKQQLVEEGVLREHITETISCTHCDPKKFFSYRRDRPEEIEAMVAVIGMK